MIITFVMPIGAAYLFTHIGRGIVVNPDLGAPAQAVTLETSDGLTLRGSYVPSRNGAAIIVSPGYNSTPDQARMLVRHGYGVLLFDQRGEGRSDGDPNAFGWSAEKDHNAAVAFLQSRPDVDPDRIGGLGLSVARRDAAADRRPQPRDPARSCPRAPATARCARCSTCRRIGVLDVAARHFAVTASTALFASEAPPANLRDLVADIAPRAVFLISAGHGVDTEVLNRKFYAAAGEPRTLWEIPEAGHTERAEGEAGGVRAAGRRVLRPGTAPLTGVSGR